MRQSMVMKIERLLMEAMDGTGKDWRLRPETATVVAAALKAVEDVQQLVNQRSTKKNCNNY